MFLIWKSAVWNVSCFPESDRSKRVTDLLLLNLGWLNATCPSNMISDLTEGLDTGKMAGHVKHLTRASLIHPNSWSPAPDFSVRHHEPWAQPHVGVGPGAHGDTKAIWTVLLLRRRPGLGAVGSL